MVVEDPETHVDGSQDEGEEVEFFKSARQVLYCPMCGLPPEYCEFNPKRVFNKCKPWLMKNLPDLYPQLKEEEEKKRKKAKRPKGTFYTWYDIGLFHNVRTAQIEKRDLVNYRGKIKLHGTNVAVTIQHNGNELYIQSRNTFLTKEADHHGFAKWALDKDAKEYFKSLYRRNAGYRAITVYGEWCGKGIMKGAAICKLDKRLFSVFAILYDRSKLITAPDRLEAILTANAGKKPRPAGMIVIPWVTETVPLLFSDKEQLLPKVDEMNRLVEAVDTEDPWVKETFGVSGTGEGIVWYPVGLDDAEGSMPLETFREFVFKTKGPTHTMVSSKKSVHIAPEVVDSAEAFMEMFVTEARLRQGWEEVCRKGNTEEEKDATQDLQKIGDFVSWVCRDVEKESKDELKESNLTWPQVSGLVNVKARKWFMAEINKRGGVVVAAEEDLADPPVSSSSPSATSASSSSSSSSSS